MSTNDGPDLEGEPKEENRQSGFLHLFLSLYLPSLAMGLANGLVLPVLPELAKSFGVGVGTATLVFIAYLAGTAVAPIPTGLLIDRIGRRKVLLAGPCITGVAALLVARAAIGGTFQELLVYQFIGGIGQQVWMVSRLSVIADTGSSGQRGRQITSMDGLQQVGILIGPALGGFLAVTWGIWLPFTVQGILILAAIIPSFFIVKETMIRVPSTAHAANLGAPPGGQERRGETFRAFLKDPIPTVLAIQFLGNLTRGALGQGGVMILYASYAYNADPAVLGLLRSSTAIVGLPITFSAGYIMDRFGRKFTLIPSLSLGGACMMFMALTYFASLPFISFILAFVALHLSMSLMAGNMQTLGSDVAPAYARGRFFGVSRMVSQSGSLASPSSFAILSQLVNFGAAFAFLGGSALAGAFIVVFILKETLQKTPNQTANQPSREI